MPAVNVNGNASGSGTTAVASTLTCFANGPVGGSIPNLPGDFFVVAIALDNASAGVVSVTDSASNSYTQAETAAHSGDIGATILLYYANSATGPITSITVVTSIVSTYFYVAFGLSNVEVSSPLNSVINLVASAGTSVNGPNLTPTLPGVTFSMIYTGSGNPLVNGVASGTALQPPWYLSNNLPNGGRIALAYAIAGDAYPQGLYPLWTLASSHDSLMLAVAFNQDPPPYTNYRVLHTDHTKCGSADSTNFPVLVSFTDAKFKTVGNGGEIQNTVSITIGSRTFSVPADMVFSSDIGGYNTLAFEWEFYNAATGLCIVWVMLPTLSHSADTYFYCLYNCTTVTTYQGGSQGAAWNSNFIAVYHMPDGTTEYSYDSSANGLNLTPVSQSPTATSGKVDGGTLFAASGSQAYTAGVDSRFDPAAVTYSCWIHPTTLPSGYQGLVTHRNSGSSDYTLLDTHSVHLAMYVLATGGAVSYDATGASLSTGAWQHVALTYDSSQGLIGYLNGASDGTAAANGAIEQLGSVTQLIADDSSNITFDGAMDEVRISNVARSASWILSEYNNMNSPSTFVIIGSEQQSLTIGWYSDKAFNQPQDNTEIIGY